MTKLKKIDAAIRDFYQKKTPPVSSDLISAILYSVDSGGKRIRPLIFLDLLEGFGLELTPSHFDIAASLEMIHTGSLIHDDLPAMDDDDYRRGRLTNHKKFDEATAILAGRSLCTCSSNRAFCRDSCSIDSRSISCVRDLRYGWWSDVGYER